MAFTKVTPESIKKSLARRFVPLADNLRDLLTKFGLRTYNVALVRVRWSGGMRGVGVPEVIKLEPLLPTPAITDLSALTELVQPVGLDEVGSIELSGLSGRYSEEFLRGLDYEGESIPVSDEVFYEIEFPRTDGGEALKRRFYGRSAPTYSAGKLQWSLRLERAHDDRPRDRGNY